MRRIVLTLAGGAVLAACGAAGPSNSPAASSSGPGSSGATILTRSTSLGTVLTDSRGFTLYYFLPEKNSTVGACTGGCLSTWPPLTAAGSAGSGITGTLGTVAIMLNGGAAVEVTYNGWPLHTYAGDTAPGQTSGNGVGNSWFAAMPGTTSSSTGTTGSGATTPTSTPGGYGY
jgi:predicted lipoprotein with Yx(FWY)xxD motif